MTTSGTNDMKANIQKNYDDKALDNNINVVKRQMRSLIESNDFNNWIKSVLMNVYSTQMCKKVQKQLDLKKGDHGILHVLDIGCGRGQDLLKWKNCRVSYMVASDFSGECLKQYQRRWHEKYEPYKLYTVAQDFTKRNLYYQVQHSYYDMVSAQFCFHYMFGTQQGLRNGLLSIFSNLLIGGVFIATIPDSYTILKKIHEKGTSQDDGSVIYDNQYLSIKFKNTQFKEPYGNVYQFYLDEAVGNKNPETGQIQYVEEWLISLDDLQKELNNHGVIIETTMNFLEFYLKYRSQPQYRELFHRFKNINYGPGQQMKPQIWEIGHLYRILVCRKTSKGKTISQFNLKERQKASAKQLYRQRRGQDNRDNRWKNKSSDHYDQYRENHSRSHSKNDFHRGDNRGDNKGDYRRDRRY